LINKLTLPKNVTGDRITYTLGVVATFVIF